MENPIRQHLGKNYAFDAIAQGKGLWKQVTKAGKLGKIAPQKLQKMWGNPNPTILDPAPVESKPQTNTESLGEKIYEKSPFSPAISPFNKKTKAFKADKIITNFFRKSLEKVGMDFSANPILAYDDVYKGKKKKKSKDFLDNILDSPDSESKDNLKPIAEKISKSNESTTLTSDSNSILDSMSKHVIKTNDLLTKLTEEIVLVRKKLYEQNSLSVKLSKTSTASKDLSEIKKNTRETSNVLKKVHGIPTSQAKQTTTVPQKNTPKATTAAKTVSGEVSPQEEGGGNIFDTALDAMDALGDRRRAGRTAGRTAGTAGRTAGRGLLGRAAGAAGRFAGFAGLAYGVGALGDAVAGATGRGGELTEEEKKKDEENWNRMSFLEKLQSGTARGLEKTGQFFGFGNMSNAASRSRVSSESDYFGKQDADKFNKEVMTTGAGAPGSRINIRDIEEEAAKQELPNDITFSEMELSQKDPELYKQFVERREQLKQELVKNPRYQSRLASGGVSQQTANSEIEDGASTQAKLEFAERAEKVGAAQIRGARPQNKPPMQDQTKSYEMQDTSLDGTDQSSKFFDNQQTATPSSPTAVPARQQNTQENLARMKQALAEQGITDPNLQQATLANVMKETGGTNVSENLNYRSTSNERIRKIFGSRASQYSDEQLNEIKKDPEKMGELMYGSGTDMGRKMGNTEAGEGYKFRGRGFVQLTGKTNYAKASQALFGDDRLVKDPDLLNDPDIAAKASAWYMKDTQAGMAKQLGIDPKNMTPEQAQLLATSQIAGRDVSKMGDYGKELQSKVAAAASGNQVQTAMASTAKPTTTPNVALASAEPIAKSAEQKSVEPTQQPQINPQLAQADLQPQPRQTGSAINQAGDQMAAAQSDADMAGQAPGPTIINNNTGGGGGGVAKVAPPQNIASVRNDDNSLMRMQNMIAMGSYV